MIGGIIDIRDEGRYCIVIFIGMGMGFRSLRLRVSGVFSDFEGRAKRVGVYFMAMWLWSISYALYPVSSIRQCMFTYDYV